MGSIVYVPRAGLMGSRGWWEARGRLQGVYTIGYLSFINSIWKTNSQLFPSPYPHPLGWSERNSLLYDKSISNSNKEIIFFLNPIVWMAHYNIQITLGYSKTFHCHKLQGIKIDFFCKGTSINMIYITTQKWDLHKDNLEVMNTLSGSDFKALLSI